MELDMDNIFGSKIMFAIIPLILIQLVLIIVSLRDWMRRTHFKNLTKWIWLIVILFVNIIGPILYLTMGRDQDHD